MARTPPQHIRRSIGKAQISKSRQHAPRERRSSARQRGYTSEWDKFSRAFLARNPRCEYCAAKGMVVAASLTDHDLPHEHDPHLFWNNTFTALCTKCHSSTKQRMERRYQGDALLAAIRKAKGK